MAGRAETLADEAATRLLPKLDSEPAFRGIIFGVGEENFNEEKQQMENLGHGV